MKILLSILLALFLTQADSVGVGQERSAVLNKIEAGVKEQQPTWKLLKKQYQDW